MKAPKDIKKALSICTAWSGCQHETNPECPYRITDFSCDWTGLINDAYKLITNLEDTVKQQRETMNKAAAVLGCDCDHCDRW